MSENESVTNEEKSNKVIVTRENIGGYCLKPVIINTQIMPFYINISRLTDMYAIQNGGYSEYIEWSHTNKDGSSESKEGKIEAGVKLAKFANADAGGMLTHNEEEAAETVKKAKVIQTAASMLHSVLDSRIIANKASNGKTEEETDFQSEKWICMKARLRKPYEQKTKSNDDNKKDSFRQRKWKKQLEKVYQSFNGIPNRAPAILWVQADIKETNSPCPKDLLFKVTLSREYLYQCELDDIWDIDLICLGRVLPGDTNSKIEIAALFC